jgi:hypothetical protein
MPFYTAITQEGTGRQEGVEEDWRRDQGRSQQISSFELKLDPGEIGICGEKGGRLRMCDE